jgi:hypothetical protein
MLADRVEEPRGHTLQSTVAPGISGLLARAGAHAVACPREKKGVERVEI